MSNKDDLLALVTNKTDRLSPTDLFILGMLFGIWLAAVTWAVADLTGICW